MTPRIRTGTVAIALTLGVLLTGCTPSEPTPSPAPPSTTATPSPSPTDVAYEPIGNAGEVEAPIDANTAITDAADAITDYLNVRAEILGDMGANPERIEPYAIGPALDLVRGEAADEVEKGITITGVPVWEPSPTATDTGFLNAPDGTVIENGVVFARGCYDGSAQTSTTSDGSAPNLNTNRRGPAEIQVYYIASEKTWKVNALIELNGQEGAPQC